MTITPIEPPSNIDYGTVVWRAVMDVADGVDPGTDPDFVPPTGTVTFVASVSKVLDPGALPVPITVLRTPIIGVLDEEGYLCTADPVTRAPLYRGVQLIATDDPDLNPLNFVYNVSYQLRDSNNKTMKYPESHLLAVPTGSTQDLTNFIEPDDAQAIGIPQANALAAAAAADAAAAALSAAAAQAALVDSSEFVGDEIATDGTPAERAVTAKVEALTRTSLFARDYLTSGASAAANRTALQAAVNAAATAGMDVCLDGVVHPLGLPLNIAGTITVTDPGARVWASSRRVAKLKQTTLPMSIFVAAGINQTFSGFEGHGNGLDMTGTTTVTYRDYVVVRPLDGAHGLTVSDILAKDIRSGVYYRCDTSGSIAPNLQRITLSDIDSDGTWCGVVLLGVTTARVKNIRGTYKKCFSTDGVDTGQPPHLIYITATVADGEGGASEPDFYNEDVVVTDGNAWDSTDGAGFALKYCKGLVYDNLAAHNNEGVLDLIGNVGAIGGSYSSTMDTYPYTGANASFSSKRNVNCRFGPGVIQFKSMDHGMAIYSQSGNVDVTIDRPKVIANPTVDHSTASGTGMIRISGTGTRLLSPDVTNANPSVKLRSAISVFAGSGHSISSPRCSAGFSRGVDFPAAAPGVAGASVEYDPAALLADAPIRMADTQTEKPKLTNTAKGYPGIDPRAVAWNLGETLQSSAISTISGRWGSGHLAGVVSGTWVNNGGFIQESAAGSVGMMTVDPGTPHVDVRAPVLLGAGAGRAGLVVRETATSTFLAAVLTVGAVLLVARNAESVPPAIETFTAPIKEGRWYDLRIVARDEVIQVYLDGTLVITHVLSTPEQALYMTGQNAGLHSRLGSANRFGFPTIRTLA